MASSSDVDDAQVNKHHTISNCNTTTTKSKLVIMEKSIKKPFLVDTGADVSVMPPENRSNLKEDDTIVSLYAANGTKIKVYDLRRISIDLGLRRDLSWNFIIADVSQPIMGYDFLSHFDLLVDCKRKRLIDNTTGLHTTGTCIQGSQETEVKTINTTHPFAELLREFPSITTLDQAPKPIHANVYHHIDTKGPPVFCRPRRLDPSKFEAAKKEFEYLMKIGICQPSKSSYASPLHMVPKDKNNWRPCGDYRALNAQTIPDRYPVPYLQDFTNILHEKKVFSKVDLKRAYHQVPVRPEDVPKTAITTPFGLFEFKYMPFGLRSASQTFQRLMHEVCRGLDFLFIYLDDICIASDNMDQHKEHLRQLFKRLEEYNLTINLEKCVFGQQSIIFLGHKIDANGLHPIPEKVEAIRKCTLPTVAQELKSFLATINFYRRFIPHAVNNQMILQKLINGNKKRDKTPILWNDEAKIAFEKCKHDLCKATLLAFPAKNAELSIWTDASDQSIGAVLHQLVNGIQQPLGFYSKKLSTAQQKYSTYDRELTAIYQGVQHFEFMVEGRICHIMTDHKPLTSAFTKISDKASPRQIRYLDYISQFTTDIRHISGELNVTADFLSRINEISTSPPIFYQEIAIQQDTDNELNQLIDGKLNSSLKLKKLIVPGSKHAIFCDVSTSKIRPFIPKASRPHILKKIHDISHPGARGTTKLLTERFIWPNIKRDCTEFAKTCIKCQRSKVSRHIKSPIATYKMIDHRFQHLNIDLIGPMPPSNGFRYCLTIIDRFTRWPEAIPIENKSAELVAKKIIECWISRFGVPARITTDQGKEFEAFLFREMNKILGIEHLRTTSYHPQANGMIERWHRTLKSAIMCRDTIHWSSELPMILLGLRSTFKEDVQCAPSEMVYGTTLQMPGQFFDKPLTSEVSTEFVKNLRDTMDEIRPKQTAHHGKRPVFVHKALDNCTHVFVRNDAVRKSLQPPYNGPFEVLQRREKCFKVRFNRTSKYVSIDRLKPAFLPFDDAKRNVSSETKTSQEKIITKPNNLPPQMNPLDKPIATETPSTTVTTRAGRRVKFPDRLSYG